MPRRTKRKPSRYIDEDDAEDSCRSPDRSSKKSSKSRRQSHERESASRDSLRHEIDEIHASIREMREAFQSHNTRQESPRRSVTPRRSETPRRPSVADQTDNIGRPDDEDNQYTRGMLHDIMSSYGPQPRPVLKVGVDITAHVPAPLKAKIWRDEYVELSQLLPAMRYRQETFTLALDPSSNSNLGLKVTKPKPYNLTIEQWDEAFLIYMAIYTQRYNVCPAMCTYMRDVKVLAQHDGNFRYYDEQFRLYRQSTHDPWDTIVYGLYFQATNPIRPKRTQNPTATVTSKSPFRVPRGFCVAYHTSNNFCKSPQKCQYKHACPNCSEKHPMFKCDKQTKQHPKQDDSQKIQKPPNTGYSK